MASAKFSMFRLTAHDKLWKTAEESGEMEVENGEKEWLSLKRHISMDEKFEDNMFDGRLFGIPKSGPYVKTFLECLCNGIKDLSTALTKSLKGEEFRKPIIEQETTEDGLPLELRHQVCQIGQLLQWIVNSSSWECGVYKPYDAFEIGRKLDYIHHFSDKAMYKNNYKEHTPIPANIYPGFEPIEAAVVDKAERALVVGTNLGDLINRTVEMISAGELEYEEKFYYLAQGSCFSLYREEQLETISENQGHESEEK